MTRSLVCQREKLQCLLTILHLPKLLLIGLTAKNSKANPSKYHLPPAELSSHREEVEEEGEEVVVEEEEVSEVVVEDLTLTLREETGPVPTALVAT